MDKLRYFLSFRKFLICKEYDENVEMIDYCVYVRVGLFTYLQLGMVDSTLFDKMDLYDNGANKH